MDERGVDHAVGRGGGAAQALEVLEVAAVHGDAGALQRCGALVRAGQADDLVPGVEELLGGGGADEAGRAGDEDAHGVAS